MKHSTVGTPLYFSPELINGSAYGKPSDAWAVGVVLFEMLALMPPFSGANMMHTMVCISRGEPSAEAADALAQSGHPLPLTELASNRGLLNVDPKARIPLGTVLQDFELPPAFTNIAPLPSK